MNRVSGRRGSGETASPGLRFRPMERSSPSLRTWGTTDTITAVLAVLACAAWFAMRW